MKGYPILLKMKFLESPCLPSSHLRFQILCRKIWESFELSQNSFLWMLLGNIRNKIRLSFLHVSPRSFCILSGIPGVYKKNFLKNNHFYKKLLKFQKKNSPFESILEKTPPSSLFQKELPLRSYFINKNLLFRPVCRNLGYDKLSCRQ